MTVARPASTTPTCHAQVLVHCPDLNASIAFFTERLGMAVDCIHPADAPREAVLSGHGITLCLQAGGDGAHHNPALRLACPAHALPQASARESISPCGVRIRWVDAEPAVVVPDGTQKFLLVRAGADDAWGVGRAGMRYRDLIPGRFGGRFIASHIRIPDGGPVPDYVHYHRVRFQMIFCKSGWVRVVYEDQGEPFVLQAGDCVLQPPQIRHRVLEASPGLEVIELGCPAVHETHADHQLTLPTGRVLPMRDFGGQRFVRHVAADASWQPWRLPGFNFRDTGIAAATAGLAGARVVRALSSTPTTAPASSQHAGELLFLFVLRGELELQSDTLGTHTLRADDCCTIPAGTGFRLRGNDTLELLEVTLPA
jgi:mannose-6-phosphate isomerase-like protein (cupin superfamily)